MSLPALLRATAMVASGAVIGGAGWYVLQNGEQGRERIVLASVSAPQPQAAPPQAALEEARRKLDEALRKSVALAQPPADAARKPQDQQEASNVSVAPKSLSPAEQRAEREAMIAKAGRYLAAGDVAGARLLLKRAAREGDGQALFLLGETHDPQALATRGLPARLGDSAQARDLYQQALAQGYAPARPKLAGLR